MTPDEALRVLALTRPVTWPDIQARHRTLIRTEHPDAGGDAAKAAELNQALEVLAGAAPTDPPLQEGRGGRVGARLAPDEGAGMPAGVDRLLHLGVEPGDLLMRLAEAGHAIGNVVFVDPQAGLLEVVVGEGRDAAQLAVTVGEPTADEVPVAFTLEPLGVGPSALSIDAVVNELVTAVGAAD